MSSIEHHHKDAGNHSAAQNLEHELTDFNWSRVIWSLPIFAVILIGFTLICLFSYQGFRNDAYRTQQAKFETTELNLLHASEHEILSQFKTLDKQAGRYQIPIAKAMELVVAEHQNVPGKDWVPLANVYTQGAAFVQAAPALTVPESNGISIEEASNAAPTSHSAPVSHKKKSH